MQESDRRILCLITGLEIGGAEMQLTRIAEELARRGWVVHVVSMTGMDRGIAEGFQAAGVHSSTLGATGIRSLPIAIWRLLRLLRRHRPRVLLTFMFHANLLGRICGRLAGVPVIVSSIRTTQMGGRHREMLERRTANMSDAVVVNSRLAADYLAERRAIPQSGVRVIGNALRAGEFQRDASERNRRRTAGCVRLDEFLWVAVGNLRKAKDYPTLLRAFSLVASDLQESRLWIAGQGADLDVLRALAKHLGVAERVCFLGLRRDIPALFAAADALVLSSAWEGQPNAVMEALAAGKPVVATRVGGIAELVQDGVTGLLVPPRDSGALAAAMRHMVALPEDERRRMGARGMAHVGSLHGVRQIIDQWEHLFEELLER